MTCNELRAFLDASLADERTPEQMERAYDHARECPACNAYLSDMLDLEAQLGMLPSFAADPATMRTVMARISREADMPAEAGESRREAISSILLLLSASLLGISFLGYLRSGQWFEHFWTIRLHYEGPIRDLLNLSWPDATLCWLGASLATVAILIHGSGINRSQSTPPEAAAD